MTIQEFRDYMASGKPVVGGGDVHMMFHKLSQEALQITAEINGNYHTPEELHTLLEQLWGREVPKTVGLFPPFHTDCGKNTIYATATRRSRKSATNSTFLTCPSSASLSRST